MTANLLELLQEGHRRRHKGRVSMLRLGRRKAAPRPRSEPRRAAETTARGVGVRAIGDEQGPTGRGSTRAAQCPAPGVALGVVDRSVLPKTAKEWSDRVNATGRRPTSDDQSRTWDGRVLSTREAILEFWAEIGADGADEHSDDPGASRG